MNTTGGRFTIEINGRTFSGRGKATVSPSTVELENGVNMDSTGYSTVKSALASLDLTFDRGVGLKWDKDMMLQSINVTFKETDAKVRHLFTNAKWSGKPTIDTDSGEVSGLKIETDDGNYQSNTVA